MYVSFVVDTKTILSNYAKKFIFNDLFYIFITHAREVIISKWVRSFVRIVNQFASPVDNNKKKQKCQPVIWARYDFSSLSEVR